MGKGKLVDVEEVYYVIGNGVVSEFIDDMKVVYEWVDLVICCLGVLMVCEIVVVGLFVIFVLF